MENNFLILNKGQDIGTKVPSVEKITDERPYRTSFRCDSPEDEVQDLVPTCQQCGNVATEKCKVKEWCEVWLCGKFGCTFNHARREHPPKRPRPTSQQTLGETTATTTADMIAGSVSCCPDLEPMPGQDYCLWCYIWTGDQCTGCGEPFCADCWQEHLPCPPRRPQQDHS